MFRPDKPHDLPQQFSPDRRESLEHLRSVILFIVRHGETRYLEREHVLKTGKWNPNLPDLKPEATPDLTDTAEYIGRQLDPTKHIIFFLSSPRARTLRSKEVLEKKLEGMGFEIFKRDPAAEILRSGGDKAPLVGPKKELKFTEPDEKYDIRWEDEQETKGARLKNFLGNFAAMDRL